MINKKGSEKEGSDMDVFTEKPSSPAEKSRSNEKVAAPQANNNTSGNRPSKTNSSQKTIDDKVIEILQYGKVENGIWGIFTSRSFDD